MDARLHAPAAAPRRWLPRWPRPAGRVADWLQRLARLARLAGPAPGGLARAAVRPAAAGGDDAGEARFRQLFHHSPLAQALVDRDGRVLDISRQFCATFGYTLADLPTLDAWTRLAFPDPAYRAAVLARRAGARQQAATGVPVDCGDYTICCRDGSRRLVSVQLVMLGEQMLTSWTDVTAQRAAAVREAAARATAAEEQRRARLASLNLIEDALAARHRLEAANAALQDLSQAIEQSAQVVVITDRDERIEYVNRAFSAQTGYSREEAIGQPVQMLGAGPMGPGEYLALRAMIERGETWRGEFNTRRRDDRLAVDAAVITPLRDREGGAVTRYMLMMEDVTERRRQGEELARHRHHLEELVASRTAELEAARAASEAANLAKSVFLANMSHEIRTPLNAVIGLAHLQRLEPLTDTQLARLDKIDAAAQHLLSIISDILDLSKIEAGQMPLEDLDFALAPLLEGVRAMVAPGAAAKGLALRVDAEPLPLLRGDATRLRQALLNFAANAVKFTAAGEVVLRVRLLGQDARGLLLRFEVQDTGIGIGPDELPRLFEPFAQVDASTSRRFGGTGLGLAINRRLAQLMGGEIGAGSQPGQGSIFWLTARLAPARNQEAPLPAAHADDDPALLLRRRHGGARVLVVEDNPINREVAEALLQAAGLQAHSAETGLDALQHLRDQACDLVLMDVQLPGMDGLEATRRIRRNPALAHLPIVAMTANAFAEDRQACLAAGMDDFAAKPVQPVALYAALLRALDGAAARPRAVPAPLSTCEPLQFPMPMSPSPMSLDRHAVGQMPGAARAPAAVPQALADLLGEQAPAALGRLRGDGGRLLRLLQQFVQQQLADPQRLTTLLQAPHARGAQPLAHEIKGTAATLGASRLAALAQAVELGLRQGMPGASLLPQARALQAELQRLADGLAALHAPA